MKNTHAIAMILTIVAGVVAGDLLWNAFLDETIVSSLSSMMADEKSAYRAARALEAFVLSSIGACGGVLVMLRWFRSARLEKDQAKLNEDRYRAIFSNASSAITLLDLTETFLQVNERWADMIGYDVDEIVGMTALDVTHPDDIEITVDYQNKLISGEIDRGHFEKRYIRKDGTVVWAELGVASIRDSDGKVANLVCVIQDISRQKKSEETLRQSEAQHRNFASDVAHELRTPLAILRTNLDQVEDKAVSDQLRQDVDSMTRMVEQLLVRTRLDDLRLAADAAADIHLVSTRVAALLAPLALREGRSIQVVGADGPVFIHGDADALELAVRNLVENAIKYSARGSTITIEVTDSPLIRIIDQGRGIPPEQREAIFTRFLRADRRGTGAGLGLSIVQRTLEAHDGRIEISDAPGGGAVFTLNFQPVPGDRALRQA